jgi:hypothetical protein
MYAGTSITQFDNHSLYLGAVTNLNKNYILPYASASVNYKFRKTKSVWMSYNYQVDFPSASQILPVENLSNPLNTYVGNTDLDPNKYHRANFSFRDFNKATRTGYNVYFGGNFYDNQIASAVKYDENIVRTTTYENTSGTYFTWIGANWNKSFKKEAHTFKFGLGFNTNYSMSKEFINEALFEAKSLRLSPRANFTYEYGELLTINPSYGFVYSETEYTNSSMRPSSNKTHKINLQTTNYWPKNWVFGNDFGYTYNTNIADGFKKDFYLWNTSLYYSFLSKKMSAKVKVYDVLNQNQSAVRTITSSAIRDEENTVLKRYMMFSLTYKIEKFAGKEKPAKGNRMMFY